MIIYSRPLKQNERYIEKKREKDLQHTAKRIEFGIVCMDGLALFNFGAAFAYAERGYSAVGGEAMLLLFPVFYYITKAMIRDVNK